MCALAGLAVPCAFAQSNGSVTVEPLPNGARMMTNGARKTPNGFTTAPRMPAANGLASQKAQRQLGVERMETLLPGVSDDVILRSADGRVFRLRGSVSASDTSRHGMTLSRNKVGPVLTGALGEQTTMIPGDYFALTGTLGPHDGGVSYTKEYQATMREMMNNRKIYGPLSVVRMSGGSLNPSVVATKDEIVEKIPLRVSGAIIMESPEARLIDRRFAELSGRRYTAGRTPHPVF